MKPSIHLPAGRVMRRSCRLRAAAFLCLCSLHVIGFCGNACAGENNAAATLTPDAVYAYLARDMDRLTDGTVVYDEHDSGAAGFYPVNWSGDTSDLTMTADSREKPFSGNTCLRIDFRPQGEKKWAGVTWTYPGLDGGNWGEKHGRILVGATELSGHIRGNSGGEIVRLEAGGINGGKGRDAARPYHDTLDLLKTKPPRLTLTKEWQPFTIHIPPGENLTGVIGGLSIFFDASRNPKGATVYLDDVRYNNADRQMLRLVRSYHALDVRADDSLRNAAFLYDNALTLLALLARNDPDASHRAKILADTLVWMQNHDRYYRDGRWRNAYLAVPVDPLAEGSARLPGWRQVQTEKQGAPAGSAVSWAEDSYQVGTDTGNMAWTVISLLAAHRRYSLPGREMPYLNAAVRAAEWIEHNCRVDETAAGKHDALVGKGGGYSGGFDGWEDGEGNGPERILWRSTEHNIDLFVAFMQLADATGDPVWLERARHARSFVLKMYDPQAGHFLAGARDLDGLVNRDVVPLDVQTWSLLAMGHDPEFRRVVGWQDESRLPAPIAWLEGNVREMQPEPSCGEPFGYRFSREGKGVWAEGTAQMAVVYKFLDRREQAGQLIGYLAGPVFAAGAENGGAMPAGMYAACPEQVETGFRKELGTWSGQWLYPRRVHLGAACWYLFAELDVNPYWLKLFPKSP